MNKSVLFKIILCISLSVMCLFTAIGYAALSDNLQITGTAVATEPEYIKITNIKVENSNNLSSGTASAKIVGLLAYQYGNATLKKQQGIGGSSAGGSIKLAITVKNNTRVDQYFLKYIKEWSGGTVKLEGISAGTKIPSRSELTFYITITNTSNSDLKLKDKEILLEFSPQFTADDTEDATKNVAEIFQNVLDGKGPDGKNSSITVNGKQIAANKIMDELLNRMIQNDSTGDYMGNVGNASQEQKDIINAIFEDATIMIGNQSYSVLMLIKQQKVDKGDTWDMVLYVTADQLTIGGGEWKNNAFQGLNYVPVYCIVYINTGTNNNPVYEYCDHIFAGRAPVCNMDGKFGTSNVGNIHTGLWDSTDYPNLTDKSDGLLNNQYITVDGELNEAYEEFTKKK